MKTKYFTHKCRLLLLVLLGAVGATGWGFGQSLTAESSTPVEITLDNSANEGETAFFHTKEEVIYMLPGNEKKVEVYGDADQRISDYIRWYMEDSKKSITTYVSTDYSTESSLDYLKEWTKYLYYKDSKQVGYLANKSVKSAQQIRFVTIETPSDWDGTEFTINCDLSRYPLTRTEENSKSKITAPRLSLQRKYIIRSARKMAEAIRKYNSKEGIDPESDESAYVNDFDIHAPIDANYMTLRLPTELGNYYTFQNNEPTAPTFVYWKFYKGDNLEKPIYTVRVAQKMGENDGFFIAGSATIRSYLIDLSLKELGIENADKKTTQKYTVIASVTTNGEADKAEPTDLSKICQINLYLEPNQQALTDKELKNDENKYRSESSLSDTRYYEPLGSITFNKEKVEGELGEGHGGAYILDAGSVAIQDSDQGDQKKEWNVGLTPLQKEYSNYAYSNYDKDHIEPIPARNEYAFLREIINNTNDDVWWFNGFKIHDREYWRTKNQEAKKYGFFMYVDADESPGLITKLPVQDFELCRQTQIIVTAWVCNLSRHLDGYIQNNAIKEISDISKNNCTDDKLGYSDLRYPNWAGTDISFTFKSGDNVLYRHYTGELENNVRVWSKESNDSEKEAEWQQVYFTFTIPSDALNKEDELSLEIANNCLHSQGGDFAVDDIRVYRVKPRVEAFQTDLCDYSSNLKIRMRYDNLLQCIGLKELHEENSINTDSDDSANLPAIEGNDHGSNPRHYHMYYTIAHKENDNWNYLELDYVKEPGEDNSSEKLQYGTAIVSANFADMPSTQPEDRSKALAWTETDEKTEIRYVVLDILPLKEGDLDDDKKYKVQIFQHVGSKESEARPVILPDDPCALSTDFEVKKSLEAYHGEVKLEDNVELKAGETVSCIFRYHTDDENEWKKVENPIFDWYYGPMGDYTSNEISDMLKALRSNNNNLSGDDNDLTLTFPESFTDADKNFWESNKSYILFKSRTFTIPDEVPSQLTIVPVITGEMFGDDVTNIQYCEDGITIELSPSLTPGDPETNYPTLERSIRIGSWQLDDLKTNKDSKYLRIPIQQILNAPDGLEKTSNANVSLVAIDGVLTSESSVVATLKELNATGKKKEDGMTLDVTTNYFDLQFDPDYSFQEGHSYQLSFEFQKKKKEADDNAKTEEVEKNYTASFILKVVPKYLTWNGSAGNNWNNDSNWERSARRTDLYFTDEDPQDTENKNYAFVPMKGSYVTIKGKLSSDTYPFAHLFDLGKSNGLGLLGNDLISPKSTDIEGLGDATENIQYELEAEDPQSQTSTDAWKEGGEPNRYYAISYYGNWCKEIYFKPEAMLKEQQYLTYDKAWVDFELTPGRWYLLASPLQNVVSGDMYLPKDSKRQETTAFENITYSEKLNDRFEAAVYQRAWNASEGVINYDKELNQSNLFIKGDWSNLYNEVYEPFHPGSGFSVGVKVDKPDKVMFRLPKADAEYKIQKEKDGTYTDVVSEKKPDRKESGRLAGDKQEQAKVEVTLTANNNKNGNYYLIGNPYMAALNMAAFFTENTDILDEVYYLWTTDGIKAIAKDSETTISNDPEQKDLGTVALLQGFFVKKKDGTTNSTVTFNTSMTTVENEASSEIVSLQTKSQPASFPKLYISAERGSERSSTVVACREEAAEAYRDGEDMSALADPDRKSVPMVYTLAGNRATVINSTPEMHDIPLGIYSDSEEPAVVRFRGMEEFTSPIYLYDAVTKSSTKIDAEHDAVTLPGHTNGRYFLRSEASGDKAIRAEEPISIYTMAPDLVVVAATEPLTHIQAFTPEGRQVREYFPKEAAVHEFHLPAGIYIIRAVAGDAVRTVKIRVR